MFSVHLKKGIFGTLITFLVLIFKREIFDNKKMDIKEKSVSYKYKLININKKNINEIYIGDWLIIIDYKKRKEHVFYSNIALNVTNVGFICVDTLQEAYIATLFKPSKYPSFFWIKNGKCNSFTDEKSMDILLVFDYFIYSKMIVICHLIKSFIKENLHIIAPMAFTYLHYLVSLLDLK
ncbi:hypothetical protein CWI36_0242p0030 [Hamiltosporidium magnivora]|uniref:Uncharacterized protein n=1 Tax=Hamiltosporidium magnivora TaxID=148818 RepID=A0A4Q9LJI2_9MICR|nr:hypothetical protein CWI36_0242p0030 [Hamiltosporidium magnivora]